MQALSKRLGLRPHTAALLLNVPDELADLLDIPEGVSVSRRGGGRFGFVLAIAGTAGQLDETVRVALTSAGHGAIAWIGHRRESVTVASGFGSAEFTTLLQDHRRKLGTSLRLGSDWVALRLRHY